MSDTEIETTIRRLLLFQKSVNNKENEMHIKDLKKQLYKICEKFHFFIKKILDNKTINHEKMIYDIINHLEFIYINENEIVWNVGDKVNEMYIIFLGEIYIYRQQNKKDDEKPKLENILEKGYSLGDDNLKNNTIRRTYLVKTKSFCILGKLSSKEYNRIFNRILSEENQLINIFLKGLKLFSFDFIERFQRHVLINYYNKNDYIFRQNDSFLTFYFIFSGTVRLMVNLNKSVKSKIDQDILIGKNTNKRFIMSRLFELRGFYNESIRYNLLDLTCGDIIGGIEYCNNFPNYKYDAKCLTNVIIFKIDLFHFNKILLKEEMEIFNKKINNQLEIISLRIKNIKEGRKNLKLNDYILSKDKFTKAFLINHPLSKKDESKTELYINNALNPFKIKHKYSNKKLKNTKFFLSSVEDLNNIRNNKINRIKSNRNIKVNDFFTNIDYTKQAPVGQIFPNYFSIENISTNDNKKVLYISNYKNKVNNKIHKNKTISSFNYHYNSKKNKATNFKSISHKNIYMNKSRNKEENKIIFNNENLRQKLYTHYINRKSAKSYKFITNINSFSSFKK